MESMDLKGLQCPFTWKECTENFENDQLVEKLNSKVSNRGCDHWQMFSLKVLLACLYGHQKKTDEAVKEFFACKKYMTKKCHETFLHDIKEGLEYVTNASASCIQFESTSTKKMSTSFKPFKDLSNESQAAVFATKACILCELGHYEEALESVKMSIELDPDSNGRRKGAWYYLAGNIQAQIRKRNSNNIPNQDELKMFERSVKNDTFPEYLVYLADSYRESAKVHFDKKDAGMSDKLCLEALKTYRKVLKSKDFNAEILLSCSAGILKLPKKYRIVRLAEEALKMAIGISSDNSNVYLHLGNLEAWHKNNPKAALEFYKKSHNLGNDYGSLNMIKIQCKINKTYNPVDDCNICISETDKVKTYKSQQKVAAYMAIQGEYYQHVKNDMVSAVKKWEEAITTAPNCRSLLNEASIYSKDMTLWEVISKHLSKAVTLKKYSDKDIKCFKECLKACEKKKW